MLSRLNTLLILFALLVQTLGVLNNGLPERSAEHWVHRAVHAQETAHHHHADSSLHVEESGQLTAHHHVDGSPSDTVFLATFARHFTARRPTAPAPPDVPPHIPPHVEGLLRPPMIQP